MGVKSRPTKNSRARLHLHDGEHEQVSKLEHFVTSFPNEGHTEFCKNPEKA